MTELAPGMGLPSPQEIIEAAVTRAREVFGQLFSPQEDAREHSLELPESSVALDGLVMAADEERKITPIPAEDPEKVKERDKVKDDNTPTRRQHDVVDQDGNMSRTAMRNKRKDEE
jgi:hypothetical protein